MAAPRLSGHGRLLLLVPTTSYRVGDFLDAAGRLGVDVAVGSNQPQVLERYAGGGTVTVDFTDVDKGVGQVCAYARAYPLRAVVAVDDEPVLVAARASEVLGLPHNAPDAVAATRDKYRLRTRLANSGLPAPRFTVLSVDDDPARAAAVASYPCVLKPLSLAAGRGVIRADDADGFTVAFRRIARILARPDAGGAESILVEDYIPGAEVALEGLLQAGRLTVLALFDKPDPLDGPFFEETIYTTPSSLPAEEQERLAATVARAVAAIGLREGPVHAELRLNARGHWVIEVAARSIGGLCARVLRFGAGVRLEELILRHALGLPIESLERERRAAGVMMIPIPEAGILRAVEGVEAARAVPGIEDVTISIPLGHPVEPPPEGYRYLGFIFARAEDPAAAEQALREAHRRLRFKIAPFGGSEG